MGYTDSPPPPSDSYPPTSSSSSSALESRSHLLPRPSSPSNAHWTPRDPSLYPPSSHTRRLPKWWARTTTWILISAALFLALVAVSGGAAHPKVRDYVGGKVDRVTGLKGGEPKVRIKEVTVYREGTEWTEEGFWEDVRAGKKANATLTLLVNPHSNLFHELLPTLINIEERFNARFGYPIQLLTDGQLPGEQIRKRTSYITRGKAKWALVTEEQGWGPPSWVSQADVDKGQSDIQGFPIGYRNMCRFFSKFHHQHPSLAGFEWIWRLDEGITFFCELKEDPFMVMIEKQALYGYTNTDLESLFVVPTLFSQTEDFMNQAKSEHPEWFPPGTDESFAVETELLTGRRKWNMRMYYNNFEIVHRSLLESEPYQAYVDYLDHKKGFYVERWGDAPVRTLALSYLVPADKIISFSAYTGMQHPHPAFECPDEPWCYCNPAKSRKNGGWDDWA